MANCTTCPHQVLDPNQSVKAKAGAQPIRSVEFKRTVRVGHSLLHYGLAKDERFLFPGGKELRNYGIDVLNGKVLYECSLRGCENATAHDFNIEEILLVQRKTQTVRAIDARTSHERYATPVLAHTLNLKGVFLLVCPTFRRQAERSGGEVRYTELYFL